MTGRRCLRTFDLHMSSTVAPILVPVDQAPSPEQVLGLLGGECGVKLLRSRAPYGTRSRYSFLTRKPFLEFEALGTECRWRQDGRTFTQYGQPWLLLEEAMGRYETLDQVDTPFPLGGCFGYFGYGMGTLGERRRRSRKEADPEVMDCHVGFHDSLVAWDHHLDRAWVVATGMETSGDCSAEKARQSLDSWQAILEMAQGAPECLEIPEKARSLAPNALKVDLDAEAFMHRVELARAAIRKGEIYQVNLARRFSVESSLNPLALYLDWTNRSPAPFSAYLTGPGWELLSTSPELFLKMSGRHVVTRPIKGTRPRSPDATKDAQLAYELQSSSKEMAELVMITDLLRNDLGRVCEFGSIRVPDLLRLEKFSHVQHLVSTVEGILRKEFSHLRALATCFPGGSITGAPKLRAMDIIEDLEVSPRGPYTGCVGYLGFNRESQFNITIRTAWHRQGIYHYHAGSGIVADSQPDAEEWETRHKTAAFLEAIRLDLRTHRGDKQSSARASFSP